MEGNDLAANNTDEVTKLSTAIPDSLGDMFSKVFGKDGIFGKLLGSIKNLFKEGGALEGIGNVFRKGGALEGVGKAFQKGGALEGIGNFFRGGDAMAGTQAGTQRV